MIRIRIQTRLIITALLLSLAVLVRGNTPQSVQDSIAIAQLFVKAKNNLYKNYDLAIADLNTALALAQKLGSNKLIFSANRRLAYTMEQNNHLDEALTYYQKAYELDKYVGDSSKLDIYLDLAITYKKLGQFTRAKEFYEKTLNFASSIGDYAMVEYANNGIGTLHKITGEYDKAVDYFLKSVAEAEKRKNVSGVVVSKRNIAEVYLKAENYDMALKSIQAAYELALTLPESEKDWVGNSLNVFGSIFSAKKDYTNALIKHQEALAIFENIGDKRAILNTLIFIATCYTEQNEFVLAETYFKRCFEYSNYFQYYDEPAFYLKVGSFYHRINRLNEATKYLTKGLEIAQTRDIKEVIQKSNKVLSDIFEKKGDFKKAFEYLATANKYSDLLSADDKTMKLAEVQFRFDIEKKENEIRSQKEIEIQSIKSRQYLIYFGGVVLLMIVTSSSLLYFLRLKSKTNKALMDKAHEIELQNEKLGQSNEILRQFAYASAHDLKEPLRSISSFIHIIQRRYSKLLPPEAEEYMNFVTSGVKRMETLLSALLEYSTVASDQQVVVDTATNVNYALNEVKENLHLQISNKNATIEAVGWMPSLYVSKLHLIQLFQNLISNSMKFTERVPHIKLECISNEKDIIIKIQDNGIGIKKEYGEKIFQLFHRLSRAPQYEGTGIGLTICKNIVDKYEGKIWFESVEGEGTTFFIAFPNAVLLKDNSTEYTKPIVGLSKPH